MTGGRIKKNDNNRTEIVLLLLLLKRTHRRGGVREIERVRYYYSRLERPLLERTIRNNTRPRSEMNRTQFTEKLFII